MARKSKSIVKANAAKSASSGTKITSKSKAKASKGKSKRKQEAMNDVYSDDEEEVNAREARMNANADVDEVYEYEEPTNFDHDSEVDEDEAFDSDDEQAYGSFFPTNADKQESDTAEESDEDMAGGDLLSDMLGDGPASRLPTVDDDNEDKTEQLEQLVSTLVPSSSTHKPIADIDSAHTSTAGSGGLTLSKLLGTSSDNEESKDTSEVDIAHFRTQLKGLDESNALNAVSAPIVEERANRRVTYSKKKDEMDEFQPVVRRNRQKKTLDLRHQAPKVEHMTTAALTHKFSAENDMEKKVAELLQAGDLTDKSIAKDEAEELQRNAVSKEEVEQRHRELAKMRSMLFYEEQKSKRAKKIKSKLYHKIRNSQDKKLAAKHQEQLKQMDPELAKQAEMEAAEKRAMERMTLKHTNTSKWVKHQLGRGINADDQTRAAISEQLKRGQELRKKMDTAESDDSDDAEDAEEQVQGLLADIDEDSKNTTKQKGLQGMKFMQRAAEKQRERAKAEAEALLREMEGEEEESEAEQDEPRRKKIKPTAGDKKKVGAKLAKGAMQTADVGMHGGKSARAAGAIAVDLDNDKSSSVNVGEEKTADSYELSHANAEEEDESDVEESAAGEANPWVSSTASTSKRRSKKSKKKTQEGAQVASALTSLQANANADDGKQSKKRKLETTEASEKKAKHEPTQEELVERAFAFAGEDEDEIAEEKEKLAAEDADAKKGGEIAKLAGMSGWGSWAGAGVQPSFRQKQREKQAKKLAEDSKKQALAKRKDSKMQRVLLNERKDKKGAKFTVKDVPYPFTSRAEYEMAMRNPLGSDWNTASSTAKMTAPKIMKRAGQAIDALKLSKEDKKQARKEKESAQKNKRKAKL